jgi:hypothetical protein
MTSTTRTPLRKRGWVQLTAAVAATLALCAGVVTMTGYGRTTVIQDQPAATAMDHPKPVVITVPVTRTVTRTVTKPDPGAVACIQVLAGNIASWKANGGYVPNGWWDSRCEAYYSPPPAPAPAPAPTQAQPVSGDPTAGTGTGAACTAQPGGYFNLPAPTPGHLDPRDGFCVPDHA